jgi:hypothetical protein
VDAFFACRSWVSATYVKVKGRWTYLYQAVDSRGQTFDFLLSTKRDAEAAKRFFRKALSQPHTSGRKSRLSTLMAGEGRPSPAMTGVGQRTSILSAAGITR